MVVLPTDVTAVRLLTRVALLVNLKLGLVRKLLHQESWQVTMLPAAGSS